MFRPGVILVVLMLLNLASAVAVVHAKHESRGLHYTLDYPETNDAQYKRDTVIERGVPAVL